MSWDAVVFDFEDTLVDLSRGRPRRGPPAYYTGARGLPAVKDRDGRPVLAALTRLIESGVPTAVITSSPEPAMRRWFTEQHFTLPVTVIGFHDTVLHRPSPHPLLEALAQLGVPASERVLAVGDSADDIEAARRAGVTSGTVREYVPLSSPPDRLLPWVDSFFDARRVLCLAGESDPPGVGPSLLADLPHHVCRIGGRLRERSGWRLGELLARARAGRLDDALVTLALRLLEHALAGVARESVALTWVPPHAGRDDHLKPLMARLKAETGHATTRLLRFRNDPGAQAERARETRGAALTDTMELRTQVDLAGRTIVVLDDVRCSGATLTEAARVLEEAGASAVIGVVLAQQEFRSSEPFATYGPLAPSGASAPVEPPASAVRPRPAIAPPPGARPRVERGSGFGAAVESAASGPPAAARPRDHVRPRFGALAPARPREEVRAPPPPAAAEPVTAPAEWPTLVEDDLGAAREPDGEARSDAAAVAHLSGAGGAANGQVHEAAVVTPDEDGDALPDDGAPAVGVARSPAEQAAEIKRRHPRAYQRWAPEDDAELARLYQQGLSVEQLMEVLGRQRKSIESRIRKLQLYVVAEEEQPDGAATPAVANASDSTCTDAPAVPPGWTPPEVQKQQHPRAYQRWTPEDDALLTRLFREGRSLRELCEALGRQAKAVESRIRRLEIDVDDEELAAGA